MAATGTKQQQPTATPAAAVDPRFEWAEKAGSYVLHLSLQGFRKDDFRVQVDREGRITVRGATRPNAGGPGSSLHKVFQLPADASLDDIAGRFEAGVLTLTVPKRAGAPKDETAAKMAPTEQVDGAGKKEDAGGEKKVPERASSGAAAPTPIDEIRTKPKEEGASKTPPREHDGAKKMPAKDDDTEKKESVASVEPKESVFRRTIRQISERVQRMEEEANRRKQEQLKLVPAAKKEQELEAKPKALQAPTPGVKKEQELEVKLKAPQAATAAVTNEEKPAPKQTSGEKANAVADEESLMRKHVEEERAKAAIVATAMEVEAERKKKATASACTAWKERIVGEVKGLADMKWADNAVEMARKNKEMIAIGVAAFSLGFFVSQRLFSK